jgi:methionyl aminopeptidase
VARGQATLKSPQEISLMREAGRIVGQTLEKLGSMIEPGLNLLEIERVVREEFRAAGALETFYLYQPDPRQQPYPSNVCVSVNDELVHGIPRDRILKDGDIVSIDLGATYRGYVGDSARTFAVGEVSDEARRLMKVTEDALWAGITAAGTARYLNEISGAIEDTIKASGYYTVRQYVGHGVGRNMHEPPQVPNYRTRGRGVPVRTGLVIALEPMVIVGTPETVVDDDGWTVRSKDGSLSCHFEHTIAIRSGREAEVLTLP